MNDQTIQRSLIYTDDIGVVIELVTPWGDHSGNIPPPVISFYRDGAQRDFVYQEARQQQ